MEWEGWEHCDGGGVGFGMRNSRGEMREGVFGGGRLGTSRRLGSSGFSYPMAGQGAPLNKGTRRGFT